MDNKKTDGLDNELEKDLEKKSQATDEQQSNDTLEQELEEIKTMFEKALDPNQSFADETEENEQFQIQELDDIKTEDFDEETDDVNEDNLCENCHKNPKSTLFEEDYPFCDECVELLSKQKRFPLTFVGLIVMVCLFTVGYFSLSDGIENVGKYESIITAEAQANKGLVIDALGSYNTYLTSELSNQTAESSTVSKKALKNMIKLYVDNGYYGDAQSVITNFFTEKDLKNPMNSFYADFIAHQTKLNTTYSAIEKILGDIIGGDIKFDLEEKIAELDELAKDKEYSQMFIEYYKYVIMSVASAPLEDQLAQLKVVQEYDEYGMIWTYVPQMCDISAKLGDVESAKMYFEQATEINKQNTQAYLAYSNAYRYAEKADPEKMIEIANQGLEIAPDYDYYFAAILANAYLLQGEYEKATDTVKSMIEEQKYTLQLCNLYALCAVINEDDESYNEMVEILETYEQEMSDLVTQYKAGKITLEEVVKDQGGDM